MRVDACFPTMRGDRQALRLSLTCCVVGLGMLASARMADAQLTITETVSPAIGVVMGGPANRQFVLTTQDTVTGADAADYMFGAVSGELTFQKRGGPALIYLVAENVTTVGGLVSNAILCRWQNGPEVRCDGSGLVRLSVGRRRLRLGVDVTTSQYHNGGDRASVSFDVTAIVL